MLSVRASSPFLRGQFGLERLIKRQRHDIRADKIVDLIEIQIFVGSVVVLLTPRYVRRGSMICRNP